MSVVRSLERRLERLLTGVAGSVFSGRLHPSEIAGRLAREADFARFDHQTGTATANVYTLTFNPRDLSSDPADLEVAMTAELDHYTADEGLRLEGPCRVTIETSEDAAPGSLSCTAEVVPGPPVVWARLAGNGESLDVGRNRALVGRGEDADILVPHDDISRRHALIWRQGGRAMISDFLSANGTTIDGAPVTTDPTPLGTGSVVGFSQHHYRFIEN